MMIRPILPVILGAFAIVSCQKAKDIAVAAKDAVATQVERVSGGGAAKVEGVKPDLQSLVQGTTEDGHVFRKDLPYPNHIRVKVKSDRKFKGRHFESSLLGGGSDQIDGTFSYERELERSGRTAWVKLTSSRFLETSIEESASDSKEAKILLPPAQLKMEHKENKWAPSTEGKALDFGLAAEVADDDFGDVLAEEGLLPRPFWFGKQRVKIGDSIALSGTHLGVLMPSGAAGRLELTLLSIGSIGGHPCGIFSLAGDVDLPKARYFEGSTGREQYSIESGKVWLSLLYPVILKEEIEGVVSAKSGEPKGDMKQSQGTVRITLEREWMIVPPGGS